MTVIFAIMAYFYKYVNYGSERTLDEKDTETVPLLNMSDKEPDEKADKNESEEKVEKAQ